MSESKHERFRRLAIARTNSVLEKLRLLGNLSSAINYEYTDEEINKIFSEIEKMTRNTKAKFHLVKKAEFKL